jgi:SAM-dependent methyltransferase
MTDWTEGYTTDVGYTYGYFSELNPLVARLALLKAGWDPRGLTSDGAACELGFGQGVSVNIHAAASATAWCATDFNPAQAALAQELANASGAAALGTRLYDDAFADFCQRTDLPDFSFIGLHGIWSWISDANRAVIVDFVRRKLRVGGVLYISYNTQPGWAAMAPMRDLMALHAEVMGVPGKGTSDRIDGALAFVDRLMATDPHYAKANPQVATRLKRLQGMNRNYLAHEYFNQHWQPMSFHQMAQWLEPAKLGFACSAHYQDHLGSLHFTAQQAALLQEQTDPVLRETVRDFLVNQQFRRDYWIKGGRRLAASEQSELQGHQRVMLLIPEAQVTMKVQATVGEAALTESIYRPVLQALSDHQTTSIADLWKRLQGPAVQGTVTYAQLNEALMLLIGKGDVVAVQNDAVTLRARPLTVKLNQYLMQLARHRTDITNLASPVSGGGIAASRFEQLFLLCLHERPANTPPDAAALADFVWQVLLAGGQRILKEGKPLETKEANLAELAAQASAFLSKRLPLLRRMGVTQ